MLKSVFYLLKPLIPRYIQLFLRRLRASYRRVKYSNIWPIDEEAGNKPDFWKGWPDNKQFAIILTHDVESKVGLLRCKELAEMEKKMGFRSAFNFVPMRYELSEELRNYLTVNGFEIGLHGLYHDGKLFQSRRIFEKRAQIINQYINNWDAVGFRSPAMHRNLDWMHILNIKYDLSTFDTDPFEPQSDGVKTIFPFWMNGKSTKGGFVELPYTLPQDHGLFIILRESGIDVWKKKVDWIANKGGMALLNTHPDYMNFGDKKLNMDEYPISFYQEFLIYIKSKYDGRYWHVLPKEIANFWVSK